MAHTFISPHTVCREKGVRGNHWRSIGSRQRVRDNVGVPWAMLGKCNAAKGNCARRMNRSRIHGGVACESHSVEALVPSTLPKAERGSASPRRGSHKKRLAPIISDALQRRSALAAGGPATAEASNAPATGQKSKARISRGRKRSLIGNVYQEATCLPEVLHASVGGPYRQSRRARSVSPRF